MRPNVTSTARCLIFWNHVAQQAVLPSKLCLSLTRKALKRRLQLRISVQLMLSYANCPSFPFCREPFSLRQSTNFTAWVLPPRSGCHRVVSVIECAWVRTTDAENDTIESSTCISSYDYEAPSPPKQTTTKGLTFSVNFFWRLIAIHCRRQKRMLAKKVKLLRQKSARYP
eukprot:g35155.t1